MTQFQNKNVLKVAKNVLNKINISISISNVCHIWQIPFIMTDLKKNFELNHFTIGGVFSYYEILVAMFNMYKVHTIPKSGTCKSIARVTTFLLLKSFIIFSIRNCSLFLIFFTNSINFLWAFYFNIYFILIKHSLNTVKSNLIICHFIKIESLFVAHIKILIFYSK